jgi:ActR/RegA family two-component response regulator
MTDPDTILIVDDEESVRKTFQSWLNGSDCRILTAADAAEALLLADRHAVDLAVLDWNLGTGNDGLQLLEDLYEFHRDIVAILVTGYANQATPLDAMRMGVRDYLDKNHDLSRETFLHAVGRQLKHVRVAKGERRLHQTLVAFREAVEKILPLVQSATALNDPVPLPEAVGSLLRFLARCTRAGDAVLLVRRYDAPGEETIRVYDLHGRALDVPLVPFARSLAASVVSLQEPSAMRHLDRAFAGSPTELQPFERGRHSLLAAPLAVAPGLHAVLELFDKQTPQGALDEAGFSEGDRRLAGSAAELGAEMLRQALAQRQTHQVLFDAVEAALGASQGVADSLRGDPARRLEQPPPAPVMDQLRQGLKTTLGPTVAPEETLRLAEAIRVLALRHGAPAVNHCVRLVEGLRKLLDEVTGAGK